MKSWTTIDGNVIKSEDLTHQHLSNIYWYSQFFVNKSLRERICFDVELEFEKRFEGKVLPYEPKYMYEIDLLKKYGVLVEEDIILGGNIIGKVNYENIITVKSYLA